MLSATPTALPDVNPYSPSCSVFYGESPCERATQLTQAIVVAGAGDLAPAWVQADADPDRAGQLTP